MVQLIIMKDGAAKISSSKKRTKEKRSTHAKTTELTQQPIILHEFYVALKKYFKEIIRPRLDHERNIYSPRQCSIQQATEGLQSPLRKWYLFTNLKRGQNNPCLQEKGKTRKKASSYIPNGHTTCQPLSLVVS